MQESPDTDAASFEQAFHRELLAFVKRRVPEQDAEDLVQEIFARLVDKGPAAEDSERLGAWLYRVARNVVTDYYRRRAARREVPSPLAFDAEESPAFGMESEDEAGDATSNAVLRGHVSECVRAFLARLEPQYAQALALVEFDGLTQAEAAERVGLSLSGMKSRIQRARGLLFAELSQCCNFERDARARVVGYSFHDGARDRFPEAQCCDSGPKTAESASCCASESCGGPASAGPARSRSDR
jgi:RNA polymerase sigma-70 factor (ECF subfamily)